MLQKLLAHIEAGKPVNYQKLLSLLPPAFQAQKQQLFRVKASGAGKWQVTIADPALFAALKQSAHAPQDRIIASFQGNSHAHPTSQSYVLVYHQQHWQLQQTAMDSGMPVRPDVVVCQGVASGDVQIAQGFASKDNLLLIENEESFFRLEAVFRAATAMTTEPYSLARWDVALAAGSRIGGALLQPFLAHYSRIVCAFDYDAAALELVDLLRARLGSRVELLLPPDLSPWQALFKVEPKQNASLQKAIMLADKHGWIDLAETFRQRKRFLEQELLLTVTG